MGGTNLLEITEYSFLIESRSIGSVFVRERAAFCSVKCNIIRAERSEFRNSIFTIFWHSYYELSILWKWWISWKENKSCQRTITTTYRLLEPRSAITCWRSKRIWFTFCRSARFFKPSLWGLDIYILLWYCCALLIWYRITLDAVCAAPQW